MIKRVRYMVGSSVKGVLATRPSTVEKKTSVCIPRSHNGTARDRGVEYIEYENSNALSPDIYDTVLKRSTCVA